MSKHIFPAILVATTFTLPAICESTEIETPEQCITVDVCLSTQTKVCSLVTGCPNEVCRCLDNISDDFVVVVSCKSDADCGSQLISCNTNGICTYTYNGCVNYECLAFRQSLYACGNGFHGTCTNNQDSSTCNCQECPEGGTSASPETPTLAEYYTGAEGISSCYLPAGAYTDTTGAYTISGPCHHD